MGGYGSGNWIRTHRKQTVEESLEIDVSRFLGLLNGNSNGTMSWGAGESLSAGYSVNCDFPRPLVTLRYMIRGQEVQTLIRLQPAPVKFWGKPWFFTCPLAVEGVACHRRISKLYLPPGQLYFGCRICHDLTYQSCRNSHNNERHDGHIDLLYQFLDRKHQELEAARS